MPLEFKSVFHAERLVRREGVMKLQFRRWTITLLLGLALPVAALTTHAVSVSAGYDHGCESESDGKVKC